MTTLDLNALTSELVGAIADGVVIADGDGNIVSWNAGAASVFGYTADEVLGQSLELIIPERLRARHRAGYEATMASGTTSYTERMLAVPATHRDGRQLSIEFRVALLGMVDGKPRAIGAVIRDVTERWHEQRQFRARLTELEASAEQREDDGAARRGGSETP
ncbi:MAG: PAS domain S-box protein [Acidimicrobiales bacterium]